MLFRSAGGVELAEGEYTLKLVAVDGVASAALPDGRGTVTLDIEVTPELAAEGTARDVIRLVQQARRDAGLEVSDRIQLTLGVPESIRRRIAPFVDMIRQETLSIDISWGVGDVISSLDDDEVSVGVRPVGP